MGGYRPCPVRWWNVVKAVVGGAGRTFASSSVANKGTDTPLSAVVATAAPSSSTRVVWVFFFLLFACGVTTLGPSFLFGREVGNVWPEHTAPTRVPSCGKASIVHDDSAEENGTPTGPTVSSGNEAAGEGVVMMLTRLVFAVSARCGRAALGPPSSTPSCRYVGAHWCVFFSFFFFLSSSLWSSGGGCEGRAPEELSRREVPRRDDILREGCDDDAVLGVGEPKGGGLERLGWRDRLCGRDGPVCTLEGERERRGRRRPTISSSSSGGVEETNRLTRWDEDEDGRKGREAPSVLACRGMWVSLPR